MAIPREILDEVLSYLPVRLPVGFGLRKHGFEESSLPPHWELFGSCDYHPQPYMSPDGDDKIQLPACFTYCGFRPLYPLRLVSRSWDASVRRLLSRHNQWVVRWDNVDLLERILEFYTHNATPMDVVGILEVKPLQHMLFRRAYFPNYNHDDPPSNPDNMHIDMTDSVHCQRKQNSLLRGLFDSLTKIHKFSISFPTAESDDNGGSEGEADCYDIASYEMFMDTILHGLKAPAFQHLTTLHLAVPGTHDIGKLAAGLSDHVKQQLKSLSLEIADLTGPGGSRYYRYEQDEEWFSDRKKHQDGTMTSVVESGYVPSNLQEKYPNRKHQQEVWDFIASCSNLETLGLKCTHYLSLDRLKWEPGPKSRGLQNLYLYRVYAKASTLVDLLTARAGQSERSIARRVVIHDVKIYGDGGNWSTVFKWMGDHCPSLEVLDTLDSGYMSAHPFFENNNRTFENSSTLWTENDEDNMVLQTLIADLVRKAGCWTHYPLGLFGISPAVLEINKCQGIY